jgi:hypothetical protein
MPLLPGLRSAPLWRHETASVHPDLRPEGFDMVDPAHRPLPAGVAAMLADRGFAGRDVLHVSDKVVVVAGVWEGEQAVAKIRVGDGGYWGVRQQAERRVYGTLAEQDAGVRTARMLYCDDRMIVLERLAGTAAGSGRYPADVTTAGAAAVVDALTCLHAWRPTYQALDAFPGTRLNVHRALANAGLADRDAHAVDILHARSTRLRVEHGDPLAGNFLLDGGRAAVLDLEHAGWHLPGTDRALMTLLWAPRQPDLRGLLQAAVDRDRVHDGYAVALIAYACHELALHQTFGAHTSNRRRAVLKTNLSHAREVLHTTLEKPSP